MKAIFTEARRHNREGYTQGLSLAVSNESPVWASTGVVHTDAVRDVGGEAKDGKGKNGKCKGKHDKSSGSGNDGQGQLFPSASRESDGESADIARSGVTIERNVANATSTSRPSTLERCQPWSGPILPLSKN